MTWPDWMQRLSVGTRDSRSRRRSASLKHGLCRIESLEVRNLLTVNFQFDYSLDTSHFFDNPQARAALEQAASTLESYLSDSLEAINPSGANAWIAQFTSPSSGSTISVNNLSVAANTLLIFVGAQDYSGGTVAESSPGGWLTVSGTQQWADLLAGRGQTGAVVSGGNDLATDFAPWGGSLSFDSVGTNWYFGSSATGLLPNQMDFLSVAQHELGHILGFGTSESFDRYITGSAFTGPNATAAFDGAGSPPLSGDRAHWQAGTSDGGQAAAMDPALEPGTRRLFTSLDFAALKDIGWNSNTGSGGDGTGGGSGGGNQGSVVITAGSNLQTTESGGSLSFTAVLNLRPISSVVVRLTNTNLDEAFLSTSTLVFTTQNWNIPQTVVVTGVDDLLVDGDKTYQIVTSGATSSDPRFNGFNPIDLTITNLDNDRAGITVTPTSGLVTTEQGGTSSFYVGLSSRPSSNVTISVASSNTNEGTVSVSSLVFTPTNWMNPQIVTVKGVNDNVSDSDKTYTIVLGTAVSSDPTYAGINPPDVKVLNTSIPDLNPTITMSAAAVTVRPDGNPTFLDTSAAVYDLDSPFLNLSGATLVASLSQNGTSNDRLIVLNEGKSKGQVGVSGSNVSFAGTSIGTLSGGTGTTPLTITFNSKATLAMVQEVVRNLQFRTTTSNKSNLDRCVALQLRTTDGQVSGVATKTVHVLTGALPPVINLGPSALSYANGSGAQLITPTGSLTDPDSVLFGGGKLTISLGDGAAAGDTLRIRQQGRGAAQIDAAKDGKVRFGKVIIGTWSGGTNGKPLVITLNSSASLTAVQALMRNITFETASQNRSTAMRTVNFQVTDGQGGSSATVAKNIAVR